MRPIHAVIDYVTNNKNKVALAFSTVALVASTGKAVVDFVLPVDYLSIVISAPGQGTPDEGNPFPISKDKNKKLRLDPELQISFINSSPSAVLIRSIKLFSPTLKPAEKLEGSTCDAATIYNMEMSTFKFADGQSRAAAPLSIPPGEIVSIQIQFAGIADIHSKDVNVAKGIPICVQLDIFDSKGRHHDFAVRAFDITEGDEAQSTFTYRFKENKGFAVVRYSPLWSMLH